MSRIKHHTSNPLKDYLVKNFTDKKFCVLDLHAFASEREIPIKKLTYSCWWLCNTGFIVKCGEKLKPEGGSPINIYKLTEQSSDNFEHVDMKTAALNLSNMLCIRIARM